MGNTHVPDDHHPEFDAICSEVEDFRPLPMVAPMPALPVLALADEERTAPLDKLILAGLVSP